MQVTNTILMIRPVGFRSNEQTAVNNYFQEKSKMVPAAVNAKAQQEFDQMVEVLSSHGVRVIVVNDTLEPSTPDSIFPNNWVSFHENGTVGLYPMFAENRRAERREDILEKLESEGFYISDIIDYTSAEEEGVFLEGTGSMILDRVHKKAYCALSERADEELFIEFCEDFEYDPVIFTAYQSVGQQRLPIYHTNVMMCVAEDFSIICLDSIDDKKERKNIINHLKSTGKEIIAITEAQLSSFAGNMLQVHGTNGQRFLVMSSRAYLSLTAQQIKSIETHCTILHSSLDTIETNGGGSARCMMAEVFLPEND
jgi:hypothetical protein